MPLETWGKDSSPKYLFEPLETYLAIFYLDFVICLQELEPVSQQTLVISNGQAFKLKQFKIRLISKTVRASKIQLFSGIFQYS